MKETLFLEVKGGTLTDTGEISGYGNVKGNIDRVKDRVMPGAYKNLDRLLTEGFLSKGHDWSPDGAIGYLTEVKEDSNGLFFKAQFHSDEDAQRIRTRVKERMEAGKSVGLSIGYEIDEGGAEFKNEGGERVRLLKSISVFEIALAPVPANTLSIATGIKSEDDFPAFCEHADAVADAVEVLTARVKERAENRTKAGRVLSRANREMLMATRDRCKEAHDQLSALIDATDPGEDGKSLTLSDSELVALQMEAYELGLPL